MSDFARPRLALPAEPSPVAICDSRCVPVRAIVCETTWAELEAGQWRSKVTPAAALGSCLGWIAAGVPVIMAGDHQRAGRCIARLLFIAARRRWRELRALAG